MLFYDIGQNILSMWEQLSSPSLVGNVIVGIRL